MHALLQRHPTAFDHAAAGKMHLYFDPGSQASAKQTVALKRSHGAVQELLPAAEAIAIEPALAGAKGLVGVVYSPEDEVGDPHRFSEQLIEVLRRDYGVGPPFHLEMPGAEVRARALAPGWSRGVRVAPRMLLCE